MGTAANGTHCTEYCTQKHYVLVSLNGAAFSTVESNGLASVWERILCVKHGKRRGSSVRFIHLSYGAPGMSGCSFYSAGMKGNRRRRDWKVADETEESKPNLHSCNEKTMWVEREKNEAQPLESRKAGRMENNHASGQSRDSNDYIMS
jgi:hypothetical protein